MNKWFFGIFALMIFIGCKEKKEAQMHNKGEITMQYDDSYINVADALAHRYEQEYPDTKINLKVSKEDMALQDLLNHKVDMIIMSRDLTPKERKYWDTKTQLPWQPAFFAADAVCFVVHKNSAREHITLEEIKEMMLSDERKLIFDGGNTSNFNAVVKKLNLDPSQVNYARIEGNEKIIENLDKYPNHIGVVGFNTFSHPYDKKAKQLRESMKVLPIKVGNELIIPSKSTLKSQEYPFTKLLYFLTREGRFGIANGLIRYSCTQIGQKIVDKEGLQPYYIYPRTIRINTQN